MSRAVYCPFPSIERLWSFMTLSIMAETTGPKLYDWAYSWANTVGSVMNKGVTTSVGLYS